MRANASKRSDGPTPKTGAAQSAQRMALWVPYSSNGHGPSVAERRCTTGGPVYTEAAVLLRIWQL